MRRPTTIPGMLLFLARQSLARSATARGLALAALGATVLAVGAATMHRAPAAEHHAPRHVAPLGVGLCAASGAVCVSDLTCGRGDRCVDSHDLRGLIARVRAPGTRDDEIPLFPSLVWNGEGYAAAWSGLSDDNADLWFARASAAGQRIGQPVRLTRSPSVKAFASLATSPAGYGLAWTDIRDDDVSVWFARLNRSGALQGEAARLPAPGGADLLPRVVWNGHEYAVIWYHLASSDLSLRLARVAPDGTRVDGEKIIVPQTIPSGAPGFAWNGDAYGIGWSAVASRGDQAQTLFTRVGAGGEASAPFRVVQHRGQNGNVTLAWARDHFGLVWEDDVSLEDEEAPISRLAFAGVKPDALAVPRRDITQRDALYTQATLAWTGSQYGLTWARVGSDGADVFFGRLDARGAMQGAPLKLTAGALGIFPSLAWSGTEFAAVWTHLGARGFQLRFGRIDTNGRRVGGDTVLASE